MRYLVKSFSRLLNGKTVDELKRKNDYYQFRKLEKMCASWGTILRATEKLLVAAKRQQRQADGTIRTIRAAADAPRKAAEKQCSQNHAW